MGFIKRNNRTYYLIFFGNLIPVIGILRFDWNITETFLFYAVELCAYELIMLPKIVVYTFTTNEYFLDSVFIKITKSFFWILYHLMLFIFTMIFLIHTAYAISATTANYTWEEIIMFIDNNYLAIILILGEYLYAFFGDYLGLKEYKILPSSYYLTEIGIPFLLLLVIIGFINGMSVLFKLNSSIYQFIILFLIIGFKIITQMALKKRKNKLYTKSLKS